MKYPKHAPKTDPVVAIIAIFIHLCLSAIVIGIIRTSGGIGNMKLSIKEINKIVSIELDKLIERVNGIGYDLSVSSKATSFICEKGFDEKNGARPLNRMIQKYIEDLIAENLVSDKIKQGDKLLIDYKSEDDHLTLLINKKEVAS